nr:hypothetical protein B11C_180002 [Bartonella sp. 1-1C]CBI81298.1 hypothetical protein B11C_190003 [Bartonella sp. 1-1C]
MYKLSSLLQEKKASMFEQIPTELFKAMLHFKNLLFKPSTLSKFLSQG